MLILPWTHVHIAKDACSYCHGHVFILPRTHVHIAIGHMFILPWMHVHIAIDACSYCHGRMLIFPRTHVHIAMDACSYYQECMFILRWTHVHIAKNACSYCQGNIHIAMDVYIVDIYIQWNLTIKVTLRTVASDLNSKETVLAGVNVLYFTVMDIIWDCPGVTIMVRWLYY